MSKCKIIFKNQHYIATIFPYWKNPNERTIAIQSIKTNKGKMIEGIKSEEWILAIESALDSREANALCKAIYNMN